MQSDPGIRDETHEFEIALQITHDESRADRRHQLGPFTAVRRVDVHRKIGDPVDARRLCVAKIIDIVDVSLAGRKSPKH